MENAKLKHKQQLWIEVGSGSVMRLSLGCPIPLVNSCSLIIFPRVNWTAGVPGCGMDTRTECVFSPQRSQMPRGGCGEFGQFEELFVAAVWEYENF